jgi:hypothetical protein
VSGEEQRALFTIHYSLLTILVLYHRGCGTILIYGFGDFQPFG